MSLIYFTCLTILALSILSNALRDYRSGFAIQRKTKGGLQKVSALKKDNEPLKFKVVTKVIKAKTTRKGQMIHVDFEEQFDDPVMIVTPLARVGGDPYTPQVQNVESDSADIALAEFSYNDGIHPAEETIAYLVMERGKFMFQEGFWMEAGTAKVGNKDSPGTIKFRDTSLRGYLNVHSSKPPVIVATVVDSKKTFVIRLKEVTSEGFIAFVQQDSKNANHEVAPVEINWVAVSQGYHPSMETFSVKTTHEVKGVSLKSTRDVIFVALETFRGSDSASAGVMRFSDEDIDVFVREDASDGEIAHISEEIVGFATKDLSLAKLIQND